MTKIAVIGAGQMGSGIAQVCATAGFEVHLADANVERAAAGKARILESLEKLVQKGKLGADDAQAGASRLHPSELPAAVENAAFVLEAVVEDQTLKMRVFADVDRHAPADAIFASNTSSISITRLAAQSRRPDRVIGMHFMNPVPLMKLVEIVRGVQTSPETTERVRTLAGELGKTVIMSLDQPGFIVNRMLVPFLNEACFALQESLGTMEDIDTGAKLGLNHPMGPFELADLIGLDTLLSIAEVLHREFGDDKYRPPTLLRNLVAAGWYGRKAGRGFYLYDDHGRKTGPALVR